jgi:hypothetical protein
MRKDDETGQQSQTPDDATPILVPAYLQRWSFGDHLGHLAGHRGIEPLPRDQFGRCLICVRRGLFTPDG